MREKLAALQHQLWADWMAYLFSVSTCNENGTYTIPVEKVERWKRQMQMPYDGLPESEKESDRELADKMLAILEDEAL